MSYKEHMKGYHDLRTLYQIDSLYALKYNKYFPPVCVEINPTNKCNQLCRYCYTSKRIETGEMLNDEILINSFKQVAEAGVKAVLIQGTGEPLMHKALPEAIEMGAKYNLSMGITTNGILLNKSIQDRILKHLLFIRLSVLDINPKRYAFLHGCSEKQLNILIENINRVVKIRNEYGLQLGLYATVYLYKDNIIDAYDIVKFYKELGIDFFLIQEPTYTEFSPAGKNELQSKHIPEVEISEMKQKIATLQDENCYIQIRFPLEKNTNFCAGMNNESWISNYCLGIKFTALISSDGNVYPCWRAWGKKEYSFGSLYESSFDEIWKGERRKNIEELLLNTPPIGGECSVCNIQKLNEIVSDFLNAQSKWKDFLI